MEQTTNSNSNSNFSSMPNHDSLKMDLHNFPPHVTPKLNEHQYDQRTQERDSSSPPGNLNLSQLSGLPGMPSSVSSQDQTSISRAWANQHGNDHSSLTFLEGDQDRYSTQNSLGLLGGEFPNSTASSTPPPGQASMDTNGAQHCNNAGQHQFSLHHHSSSASSFPSPFSTASMTIGHPMHTGQTNWQQIMGNGMQFGDAGNGGLTLHRQHSISNLSDASSSSLYNDGASLGSQSAFDPTSPIRSSFTPSQSPMGMTHSLSSLAGLAIGTPQQQIMNPSALEEYVAGPGSQFAHHENLFSLSGTHPNPSLASQQSSLMAPPSSTATNSRRRSTGVAHTLYTDQVRQLRQNMGGVVSPDDITPMPPSHQTFSGQPSDSDVSSLAASSTATSGDGSINNNSVKSDHSGEAESERLARMPTTPRNSRILVNPNVYSRANHPATMPPNMAPYTTFQTPQSMPSQSSPDDSSLLGSSISGSAFSAPRLTRMDSFDSFTTGSAYSSPSSESRGSIAMQGRGSTGARSLEATIAEHEAKLEAAAQAAGTPNHMQGYHHSINDSVGDRTISPSSASTMSGSGVNSQNSGSAPMSRVSSAPATAIMQQNERAQQNMMMNGGGYTSIPSTPSRSSLGLHGQVQESPILPVTPMGPNNMSATAAALNAAGISGYSTSQLHQAMNHRDPNTAAFIAHHHHRMHELTMSAPHMMASRSTSSLPSPVAMDMGMGMGMGMELMSPTSSVDMQRHQHAAAIAAASSAAMHNNPFGSPLDGGDDMIRSPSSGVARNATPRSRGRNAAPPPLIVSSADKLHVCYCGKRFKRLEHLKRHNRVHTQERPHPCPAPGCNKWFGRTDNLTQHLKTHYRTLGRTSESLLQITQAAAVAKANGPEARGLTSISGGMGMSLDGMGGGVQKGSNPGDPQEARHDPHAAAAAAAAQAVSKTNMKRRITLSNDMLGGPISLSSPGSSNGGNGGPRIPIDMLGKRGSDTLLPQQQYHQTQEINQDLQPSVSSQTQSISPMQV